MNPKYDTKYKVRDMQGKDVQFIQDEASVRYFNEMFSEDYAYYFVMPLEGCLDQLYGADSAMLHNNAYYVGEVAI